MPVKIRFFKFFLFCALGLLFSCGRTKKDNYSQFFQLKDNEMVAGYEYLFHPFDSIIDKSNDYNIFFDLRYSDHCRLFELPLNFEFGSLTSDSITSFSLPLKLFNHEDHFQGKGNFGVYEIKYELFHDLKPSEGFFISVSTFQRNATGIISLGITTEASQSFSNFKSK